MRNRASFSQRVGNSIEISFLLAARNDFPNPAGFYSILYAKRRVQISYERDEEFLSTQIDLIYPLSKLLIIAISQRIYG